MNQFLTDVVIFIIGMIAGMLILMCIDFWLERNYVRGRLLK